MAGGWSRCYSTSLLLIYSSESCCHDVDVRLIDFARAITPAMEDSRGDENRYALRSSAWP